MSGFYVREIQTLDLYDTSAALYQFSEQTSQLAQLVIKSAAMVLHRSQELKSHIRRKFFRLFFATA